MWQYKAVAQFAKADAPSFYTKGYETYLKEAVKYFNIRSRVATNPKEITELKVEDDRTISIVFKSQDRLNISQISRSLRVFSMYLIDETHEINFANLVSGKRLFRMTATEISGENNSEEREVVNCEKVSLDDFKDLEIGKKLDVIYELLLERR